MELPVSNEVPSQAPSYQSMTVPLADVALIVEHDPTQISEGDALAFEGVGGRGVTTTVTVAHEGLSQEVDMNLARA